MSPCFWQHPCTMQACCWQPVMKSIQSNSSAYCIVHRGIPGVWALSGHYSISPWYKVSLRKKNDYLCSVNAIYFWVFILHLCSSLHSTVTLGAQSVMCRYQNMFNQGTIVFCTVFWLYILSVIPIIHVLLDLDSKGCHLKKKNVKHVMFT